MNLMPKAPDSGTVLEDTAFTSIVTRRHPIAIASYLFTLMFGLVFVFGLLDSSRAVIDLFPGISEWLIRLWEAELTLGSLACVAAMVLPVRQFPQWPDLADLLHVEAIGAFVSGLGLATYLVAMTELHGWPDVTPDLSVFGTLAVGRFWRSAQAFKEHTRLEKLAVASRAFGVDDDAEVLTEVTEVGDDE